jgi:hypothetical protein
MAQLTIKNKRDEAGGQLKVWGQTALPTYLLAVGVAHGGDQLVAVSIRKRVWSGDRAAPQ